MSVINNILNSKKTAFSFELLPPLKGNGIGGVYKTIDALKEFDPKYINITTTGARLSFVNCRMDCLNNKPSATVRVP